MLLLTDVPSTGAGVWRGAGVGCISRSLEFDLPLLTVVPSTGLGVGFGIGLAFTAFIVRNTANIPVIRNMNSG